MPVLTEPTREAPPDHQVGTDSSRSTPTPASAEDRVLDAATRCCDRWGMAKVTVDDIAAEAGISRATLYRLFPGGKEVLYEALRRRASREIPGPR